MKINKRVVQTVVLVFLTAMLFEACGTTKGKSCKPPRKRYYHHTFINM